MISLSCFCALFPSARPSSRGYVYFYVRVQGRIPLHGSGLDWQRGKQWSIPRPCQSCQGQERFATVKGVGLSECEHATEPSRGVSPWRFCWSEGSQDCPGIQAGTGDRMGVLAVACSDEGSWGMVSSGRRRRLEQCNIEGGCVLARWCRAASLLFGLG